MYSYNFPRNCCFLQSKAVSNTNIKNESPKVTERNHKKKKSLKPNCSTKELITFQSIKSITSIHELPVNQKTHNIGFNQNKTMIKLGQLRELDPMRMNSIHTVVQRFGQNERRERELMKARSLTKIEFRYMDVQRPVHNVRDNSRFITSMNYSEPVIPIIYSPYRSQMNNNRRVLQQSNSSRRNRMQVWNNNQSSMVWSENKENMMGQKEQDMKSTMQPILSGVWFKRPRSIISIEDGQDMQEEMNQSIIVQRHSQKLPLLKLV